MINVGKCMEWPNAILPPLVTVVGPFLGKFHMSCTAFLSSLTQGLSFHIADEDTCSLCSLIAVLALQAFTGHWLAPREVLYTFGLGYLKLIVTFTILHRFFAHRSFAASRPVTFLLGLVALSVGQAGSLPPPVSFMNMLPDL